jgi:hypothetical protein
MSPEDEGFSRSVIRSAAVCERNVTGIIASVILAKILGEALDPVAAQELAAMPTLNLVIGSVLMSACLAFIIAVTSRPDTTSDKGHRPDEPSLG